MPLTGSTFWAAGTMLGNRSAEDGETPEAIGV